MVPAPDLLDDGVRVGGPDERPRARLCSATKRLIASCRATSEGKLPRRSRCLVSLAKKVSTALSQEHEVGVKWKVQRGCRSSQASTLGCLWVP